MSSAAERMRRYRKRRAEGRVAVLVEVPETLADTLVECGYLRPELADSPEAFRRALERMLANTATVLVEMR